MNPIATYIDEFASQLRRRHRRRIIAEVRAHLLDAAATAERCGADPDRAALSAVERFGPPEHVARQFNSLRVRPRVMAHRVAAVLLASTAMATLGTATVWAIEPGAQSQAHHQAHIQARTAGRGR